MTAWIGHITLRASTPGARFWQAQTDTVSGRIVLKTPSQQAFVTELTEQLDARGLALVALNDAQPVPEDAGPELLAVAQAADVPQIVGSFRAHAAPAHLNITETHRKMIAPSDALWALLDGVAWPNLPQELALSGHEHACLYVSTNDSTRAASPWLVRLNRGSAFFDTVMKRPSADHVGILFRSHRSIDQLRYHFRHFTMVDLPDRPDGPVYFRFYDPRVMLDLVSCLEPGNLAHLMDGIFEVMTTLSPSTLLPPTAQIALPLTPFDPQPAVQNRILSITQSRSSHSDAPFRISVPELSRFEALQRRKSEGRLARMLYEEDGARPPATCRAVAHSAPTAAAKFGLTSWNQVAVMARAMLEKGSEFWRHDDQARMILTERGKLPWQRKTDLERWLATSDSFKEAAE